MSFLPRLLACAAILVQTGCAPGRRGEAVTLPAPTVGEFTDDYGERYRITTSEWVQLPATRYRIVERNGPGQFILAQNDPANARDGGLWTRIDVVQLAGMPPYRWGFCYAVYAAPTRGAALAAPQSDRVRPRSGCNGHPFSRMRPGAVAEGSGLHDRSY